MNTKKKKAAKTPPETMPSKVIQLCVAQTSLSRVAQWALCEDGTIWEHVSSGTWRQVLGPEHVPILQNRYQVREDLRSYLDPDGDQADDFDRVVDILRGGGVRL